jgi:hypothetical protein
VKPSKLNENVSSHLRQQKRGRGGGGRRRGVYFWALLPKDRKSKDSFLLSSLKEDKERIERVSGHLEEDVPLTPSLSLSLSLSPPPPLVSLIVTIIIFNPFETAVNGRQISHRLINSSKIIIVRIPPHSTLPETHDAFLHKTLHMGKRSTSQTNSMKGVRVGTMKMFTAVDKKRNCVDPIFDRNQRLRDEGRQVGKDAFRRICVSGNCLKRSGET